ncbi:MAG: preprotein translocase subunit SecG [Parcubacteria group bacterium]
MLNTIITIAQLATAIILIVLVLLQNRQGGGLSGIFGGGDSSGAYRTKRGLEKSIFITTIIFSILFIGLSLANLLLKA